MKQENSTEVVAILDESGSMTNQRQDTIGSFNQFLSEQQQSGENINLTLVTFDTSYNRLVSSKPVDELDRLQESDYQPGGNTALLDAVGKTINDLTYRLEDNEDDSQNVLFWIMTDGRENSSTEFEFEQVSGLIDDRQDDGWQFLFAGADIDAFAESEKLGIDKSSTAQYQKSKGGIATAFKQFNKAVKTVSDRGGVDEDWKSEDE